MIEFLAPPWCWPEETTLDQSPWRLGIMVRRLRDEADRRRDRHAH